MIKIILRQVIDLILFVIMITFLIIGIINQDWFLPSAGLGFAIFNKIFEFYNKVLLIKQFEDTGAITKL